MRRPQNSLLDSALQNPEIAPFAMFEIDLGGVVDPQTGEPVFPELEGAYTPWWRVEANVDAHQQAMADALQEVRDSQQRQRDQRVAQLREMVVSMGELNNNTPSLTPTPAPLDEWQHFFGGETPTEAMAKTRD